MNKIKIYTIKHPISNEVRYVGKTKKELNKRLNEHIYASLKKRTHTHNWIQTILNENLIPIIELIEEIDELDWDWVEIFWIAQIKAWGFSLTNHTFGGQGKSGRIISEETKKKMSDAQRGRIVSEETKKKIGMKSKGRLHSDEQKKKNSDAHKGKSTWNKGIKHSEELRKKQSNGLMLIKKIIHKII